MGPCCNAGQLKPVTSNVKRTRRERIGGHVGGAEAEAADETKTGVPQKVEAAVRGPGPVRRRRVFKSPLPGGRKSFGGCLKNTPGSY